MSVATTNRSNWFIGALLCEGNPCDGHTLGATLKQVQSNTGTPLTGTSTRALAAMITTARLQFTSPAVGKKTMPAQRRRRKRRSAIEPKIGHAKSENHLGRCYLKGLDGDAMNVLLAGANFRKLLRLMPCALRRWLSSWQLSVQTTLSQRCVA